MTSRIFAILSYINIMNCDANGQRLQHIDNEQLYFIPFHSTSFGCFHLLSIYLCICCLEYIIYQPNKSINELWAELYNDSSHIVIIMLLKSCNINIIIINNTIKILLSPSYKTNGKQAMYKARYITYINNFI